MLESVHAQNPLMRGYEDGGWDVHGENGDYSRPRLNHVLAEHSFKVRER